MLCRAQNATASPTYDELLSQNQRLRERLEEIGHPPGLRQEVSQSLRPSSGHHSDSGAHDILQPALDNTGLSSGSTITRLDDILVPHRNTSEQLVAYDKTWHSWVHYATEYPRFQTQHDMFMDANEESPSLIHADMSWIAVYLSVLCVSLGDSHHPCARQCSRLIVVRPQYS